MRIILISYILLLIKINIMKELHQKAVKAYIDMLQIHIDTKTSDTDFHKETEAFYETLFNVAHTIWEKYVDLWWKLSDETLEQKKQRANEIVVNMRKEIETYHKNNEVSLWTEDLLGSLANNIEDMEGSFRALLK